MGQTRYGWSLEYANINAAASGSQVLIAASPGHKLRVCCMFLRADDVVTAQFFDGVTALGGTMQLTDGDTVPLPINEYGWFETSSGAALNLTLSAAKQVSGWIGYMKA